MDPTQDAFHLGDKLDQLNDTLQRIEAVLERLVDRVASR